MKTFEALPVCLAMLSAISAQFLEQPDSGTVFVPVQDQVTLTCSVEEGYVVDWRVVFADGSYGDAANTLFYLILLEQGFTLQGVGTNRSTLLLREMTHVNNRTKITCVTQEMGTSSSFAGNTVQVIFYETPPSPTDLNVTEDELGSLNISWFLGFIEGVPVNYTLTVLNLNTTSAQPIIIAGLLDQHYVFETSRSCDVYNFTVTAVAAAGNSTPSQELIFSSNTCSIGATTTFDFWLPTTSCLPTQDSSATFVVIIIICLVFAVLMTISVFMNVILCICCCKKTKAEVKSDTMTSPVYETPRDVLPNAKTPFNMTPSTAYGVPLMKSTQGNELFYETITAKRDENS